MYGMYPPWMMSPPTQPTIQDIRENMKVLKEWEKEIEEKTKASTKKKGVFGKTFTFLETWTLVTAISLIVGPFMGYLYLSMMINFMQKYALIAPLLQK